MAGGGEGDLLICETYQQTLDRIRRKYHPSATFSEFPMNGWVVSPFGEGPFAMYFDYELFELTQPKIDRVESFEA